jgi:hypothetical protein
MSQGFWDRFGLSAPKGKCIELKAAPRLKISHRLFAAGRVAAIIDRGWLVPRRYRPQPRPYLRCLRVAPNASDY